MFTPYLLITREILDLLESCDDFLSIDDIQRHTQKPAHLINLSVAHLLRQELIELDVRGNQNYIAKTGQSPKGADYISEAVDKEFDLSESHQIL